MIRSLVTENLGLKVVSLVLGLVLFVTVRSDQELTTTLPVRLVLREPPGFVNTSDLPPEAIVRVSGSLGAVQSLRADEVRTVELDLTELPAGVSAVRIHEEQLALPAELKVLSISPSVLTIRLEALERRTLLVKVPVRGEPAKGYVAGKPVVEPSRVEVEGPLRELTGATVRASPVQVGGARSDVVADVLLAAPGLACRLVGGDHAEARVPLSRDDVERVVRVRVGLPGGGEPVPVQATLRGPRHALDALDVTALRATVVVDGKGRGPHRVRIEGLPEDVEVAEPAPTVPARRGG